MKGKKRLIIPTLMLVGTLAACNTDTAMDTDRNNNNTPYTNTGDSRDNMYRGVGTDGRLNRNGTNYYNGVNNNTQTYDGYNANTGTFDGNNPTNNGARGNGKRNQQNTADLSRTVDRVVRTVKGVDKARAVAYKDGVLVAVTTKARNRQAVERNVKKAVSNQLGGKDVEVIFGEENYRKVVDISTHMRDGNDNERSYRGVRNNRGRQGARGWDLFPNNR